MWKNPVFIKCSDEIYCIIQVYYVVHNIYVSGDRLDNRNASLYYGVQFNSNTFIYCLMFPPSQNVSLRSQTEKNKKVNVKSDQVFWTSCQQ